MQTAVDIVVKANTSALTKLDRALKTSNNTLDKFSGSISKKLEAGFARGGVAAQGFARKVNSALARAEQSVVKFQGKLKGLSGALTAAGAGIALKNTIGGAADFAQIEIRLKALSKEYSEFGKIQKIVAQNAETFNLSQKDAAQSFAQTYARLRPLGVELNEIQSVYKGFNAVAIATGTSAQTASEAFFQLSQAIGSNSLQGDELVSILERVPGVAKLIADDIGVTVGELKKLGSEGKITSDILIKSISKGFDLNRDKIEEILKLSPAQQFQKFNNSLSDLSNTIGTELLPVVTPMVQALTGALEIFGRLPGPAKTASAAIFGLAGAVTVLSGALNTFGITLTKSGMLKFLALGGKVALVAAPFAAVAIAMEDAAKAKKKLDDALNSDSLEEVEGELKRVRTAQEEFRAALEKVKNTDYYKGQIEDVNRLERELEEASLQADELARRRQLIIDLKINVPYPNFDQMGPGFSAELTKELAALGYDYTPGEEVKPLKKKKSGIDKVTSYAKGKSDDLFRHQQDLDDARYDHKMELERLLYEQQRENQQRLNRLAELALPVAARSQFSILAALENDIAAVEAKGRELENKVKASERNLEQAKTSAAAARAMGMPVTTSGGRYIEGGYGPKGPNHYGAHFDIKRLDGAFFNRSALDRYVRVNGMPLSSGYTVPGPTGGSFGAMRDGGTRVHNAWDYAFGGGTALTLHNGAKFTSSSRGSYGDNTVLMTPEGDFYRIIHGTFEPGTGAANQLSGADMSAALGGGGVGVAEAQLEADKAKRDMFNKDKEIADAFLIRQAEFVDSFKGQTEAIQGQTEVLQLRNRLQLEGVRSEVIDGEVKKLEANRMIENSTLSLNKALEMKIITQDQYNKLLEQTNALAGENVKAIEDQTAATIAANDALKVKQQAEQLAGKISSEITGALGDVIKGTKSVEEAFSEMLTNIGNMFIDMAMQILQSAITKQLVGLFSGLLGGGFSGGGIAPSMNSGLPLNGFADGGYVTSPQIAQIGEGGQPEYVIPASEMNGAMKRWNAGQRGDAVINGPEPMADGSEGGGYSAPVTSTFKLETTVINGVEYATVDQVREMGRAASAAKRVQSLAKPGHIGRRQRQSFGEACNWSLILLTAILLTAR